MSLHMMRCWVEIQTRHLPNNEWCATDEGNVNDWSVSSLFYIDGLDKNELYCD